MAKPKIIVIGGSVAGFVLAGYCKESHDVTVIDENQLPESGTGSFGIRLGPWAALCFQQYSEHSDKIHQVKVFHGTDEKDPQPVEEKMISISTLNAVRKRCKRDVSVVKAMVTEKKDNANGYWEITYDNGGILETEKADILVLAGDAYAADQSHLREYRGMPSMSDGLLVWHGILPVAWKDCAETTTSCLKALAPGTLVRLLMGTPNHSIVFYIVPKDDDGGVCDTGDKIGFFWYHPYQGDPTLADHTLSDVDSKWQKLWQQHLGSMEECLPPELSLLLRRCEYIRQERTLFAESAQVRYHSKKNALPVYIIGDTHILGDGCETDVAIARILTAELVEDLDDFEGWIHDQTQKARRDMQSIYGLDYENSYRS